MHERDMQRLISSVRKVRYVSSSFLRRAVDSSEGPGALLLILLRTFLKSSRVSLGGVSSSWVTCCVFRISSTQDWQF